jgi:hypothetical protein
VSGPDVFSRLFSRVKAEKDYRPVVVKKLEQSGDRPLGFNFEIEIGMSLTGTGGD